MTQDWQTTNMSRDQREIARITVKGTFWTQASNLCGKVLVFLSTVILARVLMKDEFGVAAYAIVVIGLLDVFSDLGIGPALIYHSDDEGINDTAFWLGLLVGVTLFGVTWFVAPLAGLFFDDDRAVSVTRVLGLTFPLSALTNIHSTLLEKQLNFQRKFIPDLVQSAGKGLISIVLALAGFGVWSLIFGQLGGLLVAIIAYWWFMPWRPSLRFSRRFVAPLLSYGTSIVASSFLGVLLLNVDYLFVGRHLGAVALATYVLAFRIPELLIKQFCGVTSRVIFPVYASMRNNPAGVAQGFLATMRYVTMITVPMALGLMLVADSLVLTIYGSKWIDAVPAMRAIAVYTLLLSLSFNVGSVYKAQGRPQVLTRLALLRFVILMPALWWAVSGPGTLAAVGWVQAAVAFGHVSLSLLVAVRLLRTPFARIVEALRPAVIAGGLMALAVLSTQLVFEGMPALTDLIVSACTGVLVYSGVLWLLHRDVMLLAGQTLRTSLGRR